METRWLYTNSMDFPKLREASNRTCIIPMGCVEKHGLHCPLGTDIIKGSYVAHLASQLETVCVFPDFVFGDVPRGAHAKRPEGTICLDVRTQMLLLEQQQNLDLERKQLEVDQKQNELDSFRKVFGNVYVKK